MTKRTQEQAKSETDDALIDAMVSEALRTREEQSALKVGEVINRSSNSDAPYPMVVGSIEQPGLIAMYDTLSRELSWSDENNIRANLKKRREDGSLVFTLEPPAEPPHRGSVKCFLHPDDPQREEWDKLGYPTCRKATLNNEYQRDRHAQRKHKDEWKAKQDRDFQRREDEYRDQQFKLMQSQDALIKIVSGQVANGQALPQETATAEADEPTT